MKKLILVLVAGASLVGTSLVACSSSTTDAGSTTPVTEAGSEDVVTATDAPAADAPNDGAAAADAAEASSDGSAACNALVQAATQANMANIMSAAPTATGGTILPGTYFLTEVDVYDPASAASPPSPSGFVTTLVIAGNVMNSIQDLPDGSSQTFSETFTANLTDKTLARVLTCPKPGPDLAAKYSVTGTGLTIYETDPVSMLVAGSVYAKQP